MIVLVLWSCCGEINKEKLSNDKQADIVDALILLTLHQDIWTIF